jgi:sterol desaturase/sphingolipid hydroxylase (fatty acid hydroxylase superfamily)
MRFVPKVYRAVPRPGRASAQHGAARGEGRGGPRKAPAWLGGALAAGAFGVLVWLERRRPLRREVEPKPTRAARNMAVACFSALALRLLERPVTGPLTRLVERRRVGLVKRAGLPPWAEAAAACLLLDYTLYLWHVLTHRAPPLWRAHVVHHADLDLDATTALRFHFAELAASVPWRAAQVLVIGVSPAALSVWQTLLLVSILFHHSNVRLPSGLERKLGRLVVTPRMHGIHHSTVEAEANSNWSSGLTLWDRLHGTLRLNVGQEEIVIGVPAYRAPAEVALGRMLGLPFVKQRPAWRLSEGGKPALHELPRAVPERLTA